MLQVISRTHRCQSGRFPQQGDLVKIGYVIKTESGRAVDWSRKPITFRVGDVCAPVVEGFHLLMPFIELGSRVRAWIPCEYGFDWDYPVEFARNENLIVEIELLRIKSTQKF